MKKFERRLVLGETVCFVVTCNDYGVHYWIKPLYSDRKSAISGIEFHRTPNGESADHGECWILKGPCCHDGSSLAAKEKYDPLFWSLYDEGDYEPLWKMVERSLLVWISDWESKDD